MSGQLDNSESKVGDEIEEDTAHALIRSVYYQKYEIARKIIGSCDYNHSSHIINESIPDFMTHRRDELAANPFLLACYHGNNNFVNFLIQRGANVTVHGAFAMAIALSNNHIQVVWTLLNLGVDVQQTISICELHGICSHLQLLVPLMTELGMDIMSVMEQSHTDLNYWEEFEVLSEKAWRSVVPRECAPNLTIVRQSINHGCPLNLQATILSNYAVYNNKLNSFNVDVLYAIIEIGAIDILLNDSWLSYKSTSMCDKAFLFREFDAADRLLANGVPFTINDITLVTLRAAGDEMIEVLLKNHAVGVNDKGRDGWTMLSMACYTCQPRAVKMLLAAGADASLVDKRGNNMLHLLIEKGPNAEKLWKEGAAEIIDMLTETNMVDSTVVEIND